MERVAGERWHEVGRSMCTCGGRCVRGLAWICAHTHPSEPPCGVTCEGAGDRPCTTRHAHMHGHAQSQREGAVRALGGGQGWGTLGSCVPRPLACLRGRAPRPRSGRTAKLHHLRFRAHLTHAHVHHMEAEWRELQEDCKLETGDPCAPVG